MRVRGEELGISLLCFSAVILSFFRAGASYIRRSDARRRRLHHGRDEML